jgi:O-antigen/teichoic acid export membrane protein
MEIRDIKDLMKNFHEKIFFSKTIINFFWRSLQTFGKQGVVLVIFLLGAKYLSVYDFGIYNYLISVLLLAILIGDFGISLTTSKYVVEHKDLDGGIGKVVFHSVLLSLLLSTSIILFFLIFGGQFLHEKIYYLYILIPSIIAAPLTSIYDGIFRGLKMFKKLSIITIASGLISIAITFFLIIQYGLLGAIISQNIYYVLLLIALVPFVRDFKFKYDHKLFIKVFKYSFFVGLMTVGYFLYIRTDMLFLGYSGLINDISYYEIINKIFMLLILPVTLFGTVVAPDVTKLFQLKEYDKIKLKLKKKLLFLFFGGFFSSAICYFAVWFLLKNNSKYDVKYLLSFLLFFLILIPLKYVVNFLEQGYLLPGGYAKNVSIFTIFFGVLNFILDLFLVGKFKFYGVIFSTFICLFLLNIFILVFAIKKFFYNKN